MDYYDIFPIKPKIYINRNEMINTKLGLILTISIYSLSLLLSFSYMKNFIQGNIYTVSYNKEYKQQYKLNLTEKPIFLGLSGNNISYSNWYKIFQISAYQIFVDNSGSKRLEKNIVLGFESCLAKKKYQENLASIPEVLRKEPPFCLKSPNNNLTIYGQDNNVYDSSYIVILFSKCKNSTVNNFTCYSPETIKESLSQSKFYWGSLDYKIDHDLSDPFKTNIFLDWYHYDKHSLNAFRASFKEVVYDSWRGFFVQYLEKYSNSLHDETEFKTYDRSNIDPNSTFFLSMSIIASGRREIHHRRYGRVEEVMAQIMVMIKFIGYICAVFVDNFWDKIYYEHFINCLLSFNEPKNKRRFNTFMQTRQEMFGDLDQEKHNKYAVYHERVNKKKEY